MANKGLAALDDFSARVLSSITDPEQRAKAEAGIAAIKAVAPAAQAFGDGIAGQSEIDRQMQALTTQTQELTTRQQELDQREERLGTWHGELTNWYTENKGYIEKGKKAGAAPTTTVVDPTKTAVPAGVLTEEQLAERFQQRDLAYLGFARDQSQITREHFAKFGEIVDLEPLLQHPSIAKIGLTGVYELVHKERLTQHETQQKAKAEEAIRLDERQKVNAANATMPYLSPTGAGSGSPLDALTVGKPDSVADAAAAHYHRLQQERVAGTAR